MLSHGTQATERGVGFGPANKRSFDRGDYVRQRRKISIVQTQTTGQLPNTLDGIKIGTIGREKRQAELWLLRLPPLGVQDRVMVVCASNRCGSCANTNLPSRKRTAPKYPMLLRVG